MKSHMARFADVQVGDSVYYVEDTLWGSHATFVPVAKIRHDGDLIELELRQNGRLVAKVLHSANIEIRLLDRQRPTLRLVA